MNASLPGNNYGYAPTYKFPTLQELYAEDSTAFRNDQFQQLLNQDPPAQWVKVEKGIPYLPIDKVELLLDRIFVGLVQVDVKELKVVFNSLQATVRVSVFHPIKQMWIYNDGVGAMPIQLQKGATPGDMTRINHSAIQMNAPAAVSYAVKDAAERFGKIFGRDLSRKDTVSYQPAFISDPFVEGSQQATAGATGNVTPPPPPPVPGQYQQWQQPTQTQQFVPRNEGVQVQQPAQQVQQWQQPQQVQQPVTTQPTQNTGGFNNNFFNDPNQHVEF